jgi:hypothetical protein
VGVLFEELVPGVEYGDDPGRGPEMGPAHKDQCPRGGVEEQPIGGRRVSEKERVQAVRERENLVEVGNWKQVSDLGLDPERLVQALALGAVPVAAGVIDGVLALAAIAAL